LDNAALSQHSSQMPTLQTWNNLVRVGYMWVQSQVGNGNLRKAYPLFPSPVYGTLRLPGEGYFVLHVACSQYMYFKHRQCTG